MTNTPEFGAKGVTESEYWGPARNPWNTEHTPGGSSGGSGAAVAAGIVPAAGANDGGGSIRIPAACNGLVGLKASRGLSPYGPQTGEPMFGMVTQGVVSRTVRDSAALYDAIIGPDPHAAYQVALPEGAFADHIKRRPGSAARSGTRASSAINPHPDREAVAAVERAATLLSDLGHQVEEVPPPYDDAALARDFLTIWFAQLYRHVAEIKQRIGARDSDFEADTLAVSELGRSAGVLAPMLRAGEQKQLHPIPGDVPRELRLLPDPDPGHPAPCGRCHGNIAPPTDSVTDDQQAARGKGDGAQRDSRSTDPGEPGLGTLHAARQPHRAARDQRAVALDRRRASARRAVRRTAGRGRRSLTVGSPTRRSPSLVPPASGARLSGKLVLAL